MTSQTTSPRLTPKFSEALAYAAEKHANQTRKGGDIPYLGHLLTVAGFVIEADGTEAQAIAALLHDAAEDQGGEATLAEIRREVRRRGCRHRRRMQRHRRDAEAAVARAQAALHRPPARGVGRSDLGVAGRQAAQRARDPA